MSSVTGQGAERIFLTWGELAAACGEFRRPPMGRISWGVNRHFDFIRETVRRLDGTVVKTLGDRVMCAFSQLDDALEAALTMQEQVAEWCQAQGIEPIPRRHATHCRGLEYALDWRMGPAASWPET